MRRTPAWLAWLLVAVVAVGAAYLKFNREVSPLIYIPLVTVPALVVGFVFGGGDESDGTENPDRTDGPDETAGRTVVEPEKSPE